jgi:hypothetical protein
MSIQTDIKDALLARITTVTALKTINFERILISIHDFNDHEMPAAQLFDIGETITHERGRALRNWAFSLEIIMKSLVSGTVTQSDLLNLRRDVEQALWNIPNLRIPGVVHLIYTGNITDLHTLEPYFITRIDFEVLYYDNLTGSC